MTKEMIPVAEYMRDTYEDAYYFYLEAKEKAKCDWEEYLQRKVHREEQHPMVFPGKKRRRKDLVWKVRRV